MSGELGHLKGLILVAGRSQASQPPELFGIGVLNKTPSKGERAEAVQRKHSVHGSLQKATGWRNGKGWG